MHLICSKDCRMQYVVIRQLKSGISTWLEIKVWATLYGGYIL